MTSDAVWKQKDNKIPWIRGVEYWLLLKVSINRRNHKSLVIENVSWPTWGTERPFRCLDFSRLYLPSINFRQHSISQVLSIPSTSSKASDTLLNIYRKMKIMDYLSSALISKSISLGPGRPRADPTSIQKSKRNNKICWMWKVYRNRKNNKIVFKGFCRSSCFHALSGISNDHRRSIEYCREMVTEYRKRLEKQETLNAESVWKILCGPKPSVTQGT